MRSELIVSLPTDLLLLDEADRLTGRRLHRQLHGAAVAERAAIAAGAALELTHHADHLLQNDAP